MNNKILYSPKEADQKLRSGAAILVDVRDAEDFEKGHISGAVNIPEMFTTLSMTTPDGLQEMQDILIPLFRNAGIRHDKTVIVYEDCLNTRYGGSCRGYFQLRCLATKLWGFLMVVCLNGYKMVFLLRLNPPKLQYLISNHV